MKSPFPWFGGKRKVANIVWHHFGDVPNYVEPFAGSLAVLLGRKTKPKIETINDLDCFVANFWRSLKNDPDELAKWANDPINEADLHAKHKYLLKQKKEFKKKMHNDPDFFDTKIAGWWAWGIAIWIGDGWCVAPSNKRPALCGGIGVHRKIESPKSFNKDPIYFYFDQLAKRLKKVRVVCGEWHRVLGEVPTTSNGITGVFLDPPYNVKRAMKYTQDDMTISDEVREWCINNGDNPLFRIALCGYEGEHNMPKNWHTISWETSGGYGSKTHTQARDNSKKERIWFSPYCLIKKKKQFFDLTQLQKKEKENADSQTNGSIKRSRKRKKRTRNKGHD